MANSISNLFIFYSFLFACACAMCASQTVFPSSSSSMLPFLHLLHWMPDAILILAIPLLPSLQCGNWNANAHTELSPVTSGQEPISMSIYVWRSCVLHAANGHKRERASCVHDQKKKMKRSWRSIFQTGIPRRRSRRFSVFKLYFKWLLLRRSDFHAI